MFNYSTCPICGHLHDDGVLLSFNDHWYFICHDCGDKYSNEELKFIFCKVL